MESEKIKKQLQEYVFKNKVPHIIFHGEHCVGKKHMVKWFINMIYHNDQELKKKYLMEINCTTTKGIKKIKENIKYFSQQQINTSKVSFKSVVLYDAEHLTYDSQYSLRRSIEQYSHNTRFFLICVNKKKLLMPICSRFTTIYLTNYDRNLIIPKDINETKISNSKVTLKKQLANIDTLELYDITQLCETLFEKGYTYLDIEDFYSNHEKFYEYSVQLSDIKNNFKNEVLSMFYIICLFRNI